MLRGFALGVLTVLVVLPTLALAVYGAVALSRRGDKPDCTFERAWCDLRLKDEGEIAKRCEALPKCDGFNMPSGHIACRAESGGIRRRLDDNEARQLGLPQQP